MAQVSFTTRSSLVAGNPENIADVTDCLDKLLAGVNSVDSTQIAAQQAWQTVALTGFSTSLSYFKDTLGNVHFRGDGLVVGGTPITSSSVLCTLPVGYRPGTTIHRGTPTTNGVTATTGLLVISSVGVMTYVGPNINAASTAPLSIAPFRAEN